MLNIVAFWSMVYKKKILNYPTFLLL